MKLVQKIALSILSIWLYGLGILAAELRLTEPPEGSIMPLLNPIQKAFLAMPRPERIEYFADAGKRKEMSGAGYYPAPVTLSWEAIDLPKAQFTVWLSTSPDFTPASKLPATAPSVEANNLMINKSYYWKVVATSGDQSVTSAVRTFRTEDQAPRLLRIEGVPNVRDLGGRKAMRGKRVKQGLVYRTAGLNENAEAVYYTAEELRNSPDHAADYENIRKKDEILIESKAGYEKRLKDPNITEKLPYYLSSAWTAFRPTVKQFNYDLYAAQAAELQEIPAEFMGAPAERALMNKQGCFQFSEIDHFAPSVFMQVFEAPEEGTMYMGCGADWYWEMRVNGKREVDHLQGNGINPVSPDNFFVTVPVCKGKNVLVVLVYSGLEGWVWCCAPVTQKTMLRHEIREVEAKRNALTKVVRSWTPGPTRLNEAMLDYMLNELGIKSDVDLRSGGECYGMKGSPLGDRVTWFQYSSSAYGGMQGKEGKEAFTKVFRVFLDPKNYPIVFHCIAGQDRTGAVAFILNGLLGVEEEELYLDWEATGFWNSSPLFCHKNLFNHLVDGFQKLPGQTLHEKIENYVLDLGFTKEDIEKFRSLMLE